MRKVVTKCSITATPPLYFNGSRVSLKGTIQITRVGADQLFCGYKLSNHRTWVEQHSKPIKDQKGQSKAIGFVVGYTSVAKVEKEKRKWPL